MRNLIILIVLVAVGIGCGGVMRQAASSQADEAVPASSAAPAQEAESLRALGYAPDSPADAMTMAKEATQSGVGTVASFAASRPDLYLIKNASITIEAEDIQAATSKLLAALQPSGAYISNLNEHTDSWGRRMVTLQVRVPANVFDSSMTQLESLGKVLGKQVSTQDVTEEFVDTESRTRNLKKTEERLLDHLNRTAKVEDILRVEQELTRVREEIERMDGRLRYLQDRVSFSTISVNIQEAAKAEPILPAETFSTAQEFSEASRVLVAFLLSLWAMAIWVIVWLPILGIGAAVLYGMIRRIRRMRFAKAS